MFNQYCKIFIKGINKIIFTDIRQWSNLPPHLPNFYISHLLTPSLPQAGKVPKPLMEKRRRARINKCLEELKVLVPDLTESGTRVDKADVLEMTVEHLTRMRNSKRNLTSNLTPHGT